MGRLPQIIHLLSSTGVNWQRGKTGFIPKTTHAQRQELMLYWEGNRWDTTKGREYLWENFKIKLSEKSLYNLKQKLRETWENRTKELDE